MKKVSRTVGRCLTETKLEDFEAQVEKFAEFVRVSQFAPKQPKYLHEVGDGYSQSTANAQIGIGTILYGVDPNDGTLTWLGEIIDSSD